MLINEYVPLWVSPKYMSMQGMNLLHLSPNTEWLIS